MQKTKKLALLLTFFAVMSSQAYSNEDVTTKIQKACEKSKQIKLQLTKISDELSELLGSIGSLDVDLNVIKEHSHVLVKNPRMGERNR
jgi:chromosome segregation ATPase